MEERIPYFDAVVIGGGPAGLQAALTLGRARCKVLLLDAGEPRNRFSEHTHNMIGADGLSPQAFLAQMRASLGTYPNITQAQARVMQVAAVPEGYVLRTQAEEIVAARKLVLACGVADVLPEIPGLQEAWGTRVLHCAYCHGYEVQQKPIGLLVKEEYALDMLRATLHLSDDMTLFFDDGTVSDALAAQLTVLGRKVVQTKLAKAEMQGDMLRLSAVDGTGYDVAAMFVKPRRVMVNDLAQQLGCALSEEGLIKVGAWGETSVYDVFAAGDVANNYTQLVAAAASGLYAAVQLSTDLNSERIKAALKS